MLATGIVKLFASVFEWEKEGGGMLDDQVRHDKISKVKEKLE